MKYAIYSLILLALSIACFLMGVHYSLVGDSPVIFNYVMYGAILNGVLAFTVAIMGIIRAKSKPRVRPCYSPS